MKKLMLSMTMVLVAFLTQASVGEKPVVEKIKKSGLERVNAVAQELAVIKLEDAPCSVTMKGRIDLGPIEAEVSCTATGATCEAATVTAISCLSAAIRTVRSVIM